MKNIAQTRTNEDAEQFKRKLMMNKGKIFLSIEDTATLLLVEYRTVWRLVKSGKLTAGKVGAQWRIYSDDLFEFFRNCCRFQKESRKNQKNPLEKSGNTFTGTAGSPD